MTFYQLTFVTEHGTRRTFRINNVGPALPQQDLQAAVDALIDHNIMSAERGALTRLQNLTAHTVASTTLL